MLDVTQIHFHSFMHILVAMQQLSHYALTNAIICVCLFYLIFLKMSLPYAYFIIIIFLSFYRVLRVRIHIK